MAGVYYDKAMKEYNKVIQELEDAHVITTPEQKVAMQKFTGAFAQDTNDFVISTFNAEHPGETYARPVEQKAFTPEEAANQNRGVATTMVSTTLAEWVRGPNVDIDKEHENTVNGSMSWVLGNKESQTGKQVYGPLFNEDGTPKLGPDGTQVSGDLSNKSDINKQWATDVVKLALDYVQLENDGKATVEEIGKKAALERQHAKDNSFLYAEAEQRNIGERGTKATVESLKQEHTNMALTYDKQAEHASKNSNGITADMSYRYFHQALHTSPMDKENQNLHHELMKGEKEILEGKKGESHSSLQGENLTPGNLSTVLQHIASRDPDAALAYAQHLSNGAQQTMQHEASEAQV